MRLLAKHLVEIEVIDSISHNTVGLVKKSQLKPWRHKSWCIPPKQSASFVASMEDVLEVYRRPVDPMRPLVCVDEFAKQLLSETRTPLPVASQHPARHDYKYFREGRISGFMIATPHLGQGEFYVGEEGRRTAIDFAKCMDHLANEVHPDA